MTPTTTNEKMAAAAAIAQVRARELAARVKPAAGQVGPLARNTQEATLRRLQQTRTWAAPRVEQTGQVLQDNIAPKVADLLSTAARRIEPEQPRSRNWWTLSGIMVIVAGAAAAAAVALRKRTTADRETLPGEPGTDEEASAPGQPMTSSNTDASHTP